MELFIALIVCFCIFGMIFKLVPLIDCYYYDDIVMEFQNIGSFFLMLMLLTLFGLLIYLHSYYFLLFVVYFLIGYCISLNLFPKCSAPEELKESWGSFYIIFDIMTFWPFILLVLSFVKINYKQTIFKTPWSEYKKLKDKND